MKKLMEARGKTVEKVETVEEKTEAEAVEGTGSSGAEPVTISEEAEKIEEEKVEEAKEEGIVMEFDIREEETPPAKEVYLIYGDKGEGKTTLALSFPGKIAVLSFDRKTAIIKANMYNNDNRIHIFDAVKYMDYSTPEKMIESANISFQYILALLDYIGENIKPDWVVIDGSDIFHQICEWTMRYRHGIEAFAGISNLNLWKERRMYIRNIHKRAMEISKKGVIYTTYTDKDEIVIDGELITKKDVPRWIDVLIFETDYVIKAEKAVGERKFYAKIVTSKNDGKLRTGAVIDVTDRGLWGG